MRQVLLMCVVLLTASPAMATATRMTLYLDGGRVETEVSALKGHVEMPLPQGMTPGSLRVRPLDGASLARVEVVPALPDRKVDAELARLTERKNHLTDRLKALEVREEIFRAAAKSQSGKAPRKSKNNREPLEEIRKGTEYAITQLEDVYRSRRRTADEIKVVDGRLQAVREAGNIGGSVVRIWLSDKKGRAVISYLQPGLRWSPAYDFRLNGGLEAEVTINALLPKIEKSTAVAVVPASLADGGDAQPVPRGEGQARVRSFRTTVHNAKISSLPQPAVSFSFLNDSGKRLPQGEATCYRQGEYLGATGFSGSLPGESRDLQFGTVPPVH